MSPDESLMPQTLPSVSVQRRRIRSREKGTPGPEGATSKLYEAEINKSSYEFGMELLGDEALLFPRGYSITQPEINLDNETLGFVDTQSLFLRARANSIEGGTSEIMKNIIAERVLGLPSEPKLDKDKAIKYEEELIQLGYDKVS